jgi:prophage regulatory protein
MFQRSSKRAYEILRLPTVIGKTGKCRSGIYSAIAEGTFPKPISIGARSVGWISAEVDAWIEDRIKQSRSQEGRPQVPEVR